MGLGSTRIAVLEVNSPPFAKLLSWRNGPPNDIKLLVNIAPPFLPYNYHVLLEYHTRIFIAEHSKPILQAAFARLFFTK